MSNEEWKHGKEISEPQTEGKVQTPYALGGGDRRDMDRILLEIALTIRPLSPLYCRGAHHPRALLGSSQHRTHPASL
ncbi:hypothetical protein MRX96_011708 [Rhipicephalus microplus]